MCIRDRAKITVNDIKAEEKLADILEELKDIKNATYILGYHPEEVDHIDLAVVSPGAVSYTHLDVYKRQEL